VKPPLLAQTLLMAVAGPCQFESVAGDLEEEFALLRETSGSAAARRWYAWQVVRSVGALLQLRVRSGEFTQVALIASLGVAAPLLLLDRLWQFVYSQVPLKDGLNRAPEFLVFNGLCACASAAVLGVRAASISRAPTLALATAAATLMAVWSGTASVPSAYVATLAFAAPASALFTFAWRKSK
jgi:hypothetical protein